MPRRRRVAIYVHPAHGFKGVYLLCAIARHWKEAGIVAEVIQDPGKVVDADIAFLHVDMTELPRDYRDLANSYPVVVNGRRKSAARRAFSTNLLTRDSNYRGPVIVKSNQNFAGVPDDIARGRRLVWKPSHRERLDRLLPRWLTGGVFAREYQVYPSLAEVPRIVWHLDRLVVEKFLPERKGDLYGVRVSEFLGDRLRSALFYASPPMVKASFYEEKLDFDTPPETVAQIDVWRRQFALDYGKFDYAIIDGEPVLFDVNPIIGGYNKPDGERLAVSILADGINTFFEQARRITSDRS